MNPGAGSGLSFYDLFATLGQMTNDVCDDIYSQLEEFSANPAPSEDELVIFQANMEMLQADIELLSNSIKKTGDIMDNIVQNVK